MRRIQPTRASVCLFCLLLCARTVSAQTTGAASQANNSRQQSSAKQRFDDEEKKLLAAVQSAESEDAKPLDVTKALEKLAFFYQSHNLKGQLSSTLDRELAAADKTWAADDYDLLQTLRIIGAMYVNCNQRTRATQIYQRILDVDLKTSGLSSRDVASDYLELGRIAMYITDSPDAETYFMKALAIDQVRNSDNDALDVVRALSTMATIQRNPEKADALLDRALQALKLHADKNAMGISMMLMDRANNASSRKDFGSAIEFAQESLEIDERLYGSNNPFLIGRLSFIANNYMRREDYGTAQTFLQRALKLADENEKDPQHLQRLQPATILARVFQQQKKYSESEALINSAIEIITKWRGADSAALSSPALQLAQLYEVQNRNLEAETQYRRAIALTESDPGNVSFELPNFLSAYASFLKKLNRNEEADALLQRAKEIVEKRRAATRNQIPQI